MKTYSLILAIVCLALAIFYHKESQQCIPASGGLVTQICVDEDYANNVRFAFTGWATEVFWTFWFKEDSPSDTFQRLLNDADKYFETE